MNPLLEEKIQELAQVFNTWQLIENLAEESDNPEFRITADTAQKHLDKIIVHLAQEIVDVYSDDDNA